MEKVLTYSFSLKPSKVKLLDKEAERIGISRSSLLMLIIDNYLKTENELLKYAYTDTDSIRKEVQ